MNQTYYTLVTNLGLDLLTQATALGTQLKITHLAVGDGNGNLPTPSATQTKLVNETRRAAINMIYVDPDNSNQLVIEQVIPPEEGGFYIREIGVFDENGNLIAVGNCPPSYKPLLSEGSGRTQVINMVIIVDNTSSVELKIDASTVLSTRKYVDNLISTKMAEHEKSRNHPDASITQKGFVQLSNAIDSESEETAATSKALNNLLELMVYKSDFTQSLKASGWQKLPGGLIIQWGRGTTSGTGSTEAGSLNNFPITFPNQCLAITAIHSGHSPEIAGSLSVLIINNIQFRCYRSGAGTNNVAMYYIAMGY